MNDLFDINLIFYGLSRMYHLSDFVWILHSSVLVVFNNFLLIDATEKSRISSDQKHFFIALSLYPLSFFANTPFKAILKWILGYYKAYSCSSKLLNHFLSEMGLSILHNSCAAYSLDYLSCISIQKSFSFSGVFWLSQ